MVRYLLILVTGSIAYGQNTGPVQTYKPDEINSAADIETRIDAGKVYQINLLSTPNGAGKAREAQSGRLGDKNWFEQEHNVVWIEFEAVRDGKLGMTITPKDSSDDYDFLIFEKIGEDVAKNIRNKQLRPIRSNMARTKNINGGVTGLNLSTTATHVRAGVNSPHSQFMQVTKGQRFLLAVDNVYDGGKGANITFDYYRTSTIKGTIVDDDNVAQEAEVVWEDGNTGEEIVRTKSDKESGEFELEVPYNTNPSSNYVLYVYSDDHLFTEEKYGGVELLKFEPVPMKVLLPKLKAGNTSKFQTINFLGDRSIFLKTAYPTLKRLAKLMRRNPGLKIKIEGHTNGCSSGVQFSQLLSEARAEAVKVYLIENGISGSRISTEGFNCARMLYPYPNGDKQSSMNRRVEVVVVEYKK